MSQHYFAQGKLLITGEYFVLDGAVALAVPTKAGQHLSITPSTGSKLNWKSLTSTGATWLTATFALDDLSIADCSDKALAEKLQGLLKYVKQQKPSLFEAGLEIETKLEFERAWGWGTSSTLISLLSQWAELDAFTFLQSTLGGSGYDVACATATGPIYFEKKEGAPIIKPATFPKLFLNQLFLVYLGKKQKSDAEVANYRSLEKPSAGLIQQINRLSYTVSRSADLGTFCSCLQELERFTGDFLGRQPIQETIFKSLPGAAKSLGAWGGDFALLATPWSEEKVKAFCNDLGLSTVFNFESIVKL